MHCLAAAARTSRRSATRAYTMYISPLTICTIPPSEEHRSTVIFLHGLGDHGAGWFEPMDMIKERLPNTKFVMPTAPRQPVTLNSGMHMASWFDILGSPDRTTEPFKHLDQARGAVQELIESEIRDGVHADKIVLGGFSQGGAVALHTAYQLPYRLAGVCALSTYLPFGDKFMPTVSKESVQTPLFIAHGDSDEMVNVSYSVRTRSWLAANGTPVAYKTYAGLGHSISEQGLDDLGGFLTRVLT